MRLAVETTVETLKERLARVQALMSEAAQKSGRTLADITLVAVTKGVAPETVREAQAAGLGLFGENRVQEAAEKIPQVGAGEWHLIGHLQTNKIKTALPLFSLIQSVDSVRLARDLSALAADRQVDILLEVNISGQAQRFGFSPEELYGAVDAIAALPAVRVLGLMGMAPHPASEGEKRAAFKKLKGLFGVCRSLKLPSVQMKYLSMGMSGDFTLAIEEGANMVRLGRALFGS